jgi:pimeloyl-ACP methyl ester carboxylesterase/DNA-binding CsgD family transcriptional regulator
MDQDIRFTTAEDGASIAYATVGAGPPLVRALGWMTHLELEWAWPSVRAFWERLAQQYRVIRYDGRGIGLSARDASDFSPEARLRDLEAVVNAVGLERFALFGISEGGTTAVAYAARHPDRVSHLILYGAYAQWGGGLELSEEDRAHVRARQKALITLVRELWDQQTGREGWDQQTLRFRQIFTNLFLPDADADALRRFDDLQHASASGKTAAALLASLFAIDAHEEAQQVRAPTLVIHRRGDQAVPFPWGQHLAAAIPDARFVPLEGADHPLGMDGPNAEAVLEAIEGFVGAATTASPQRLGDESDRGVPEVDEALTRREREVLRLVAAGKSNPQIAAELVISRATVARHVSNLLKKIRCENRVEATRYAVDHKLTE